MKIIHSGPMQCRATTCLICAHLSFTCYIYQTSNSPSCNPENIYTGMSDSVPLLMCFVKVSTMQCKEWLNLFCCCSHHYHPTEAVYMWMWNCMWACIDPTECISEIMQNEPAFFHQLQEHADGIKHAWQVTCTSYHTHAHTMHCTYMYMCVHVFSTILCRWRPAEIVRILY